MTRTRQACQEPANRRLAPTPMPFPSAATPTRSRSEFLHRTERTHTDPCPTRNILRPTRAPRPRPTRRKTEDGGGPRTFLSRDESFSHWRAAEEENQECRNAEPNCTSPTPARDEPAKTCEHQKPKHPQRFRQWQKKSVHTKPDPR